MASRKRKQQVSKSETSGQRHSLLNEMTGKPSRRAKKRRSLLESLESRQLLAGPQLIGIQPNSGELIVDGSTVETSPNLLTLRFDDDQSIDPSTLDGIKISRAGDDGQLGTADDVTIAPGLVTLGENAANEVVVRFKERLQDDQYQLDLFAYDDPSKGITGLRNVLGDFVQPRITGQRIDSTRFDLRLGALIESVVPQPIVRNSDGSLTQNRNEIVVYFNEDPLFVEDYLPAGDVLDVTESTSGNKVTLETEDTSSLRVGDRLVIENTGVVDYDTTHTVTEILDDNRLVTDIDFVSSLASERTAAWRLADDQGLRPTVRSVEHPRFYQLLLTQGTVRNTDDALYHPERVVYDSVTHTARLFFAQDLNELGTDRDGKAGVSIFGGTFRLRIGTAVDDRVDLILPPLQTAVVASAIVDFGVTGLSLRFSEKVAGERAEARQISFDDDGVGGLIAEVDSDGDVTFNLRGSSVTVQQLIDYIADPQNLSPADQAVVKEIVLEATSQNQDDLNSTNIPSRIIGAPPIKLFAVGDNLLEAFDVGIFGQNSSVTSLVLSESIDPQTVVIQPLGSDTDLGSDPRESHLNPVYGADSYAGVTEIPYNFQGIFETDNQGVNYLNQINEKQKTRIKEALNLWSSKIGVQFRETVDQGITFAVGDYLSVEDHTDPTNSLGATQLLAPSLNAKLRIPESPREAGGYEEAALVFDRSHSFRLDYGEDLTRKSVAGIGLLLGLADASDLLTSVDPDLDADTDPDLLTSTIMGLAPNYLNQPIENLNDLEPVFPGNFDVVHGQYLHRADSVDVDMYRFVVDLDDPNQIGTLTAETFAERLPDSSSLDTVLTLYKEVAASIETDFGLGNDLAFRISSLQPGRLGNQSSIAFVRSERNPTDLSIKVQPSLDASGNPIPNGILLDLPRVGTASEDVSASDLAAAINNDPFASSIFRASVISDNPQNPANIGEADLTTFSPLYLSGGGIEKISRNDDYFGEDSRVTVSLGEGVYYLGVSASGNDQYDPTIAGTGNGGRTQGVYDLNLKFEPQVDELDVIRDLDSDRANVPGTPIDGDGDGVPGGVHNFWFETRSLERQVLVTGDASRIVNGQVMTITSGSNVVRKYQFVTAGQPVLPGNIRVEYDPGIPGTSDPDTGSVIANKLALAINTQASTTGVTSIADDFIVDDSGLVSPRLVFSGERSLSFSANFGGFEVIGRTIFVDKTAGPAATGSLDRPFNNISNPSVPNAFGSSSYGDIVRIVGNGGLDGDLATETDNLSYQIGTSEVGGTTLVDGGQMNVPRGVTTMIDAGAAFKLRNSYINVGSSNVQIDRSGGALQVLGTPRLVELSTEGSPVVTTLIADDDFIGSEDYSDGSVIFTSTRDRSVDTQAAGISAQPGPGNWGGIIYRRDIDQAEGRRDKEDDGIFLQTVNHAEIRYGGGSNVLIDSVQQLVNPIQIVNMRPSVTFNQITHSADAAISAAPTSFEETSFQSPRFQKAGKFTADYDRVGLDVHNNLLIENSINGLFVRVTTTPSEVPKTFEVSARFDDTDVVHYVSENLVVIGSPGGSIQDSVRPDLSLVSGRELAGGRLARGTYSYKMTFVDADGFESAPTTDANRFDIPVNSDGSSIELTSLPVVKNLADFVSRKLYRADSSGDYLLVAELDAGSIGHIDSGNRGEAILDQGHQGIRGRLDASMVFDPGLVMKLRGARIELGQGTQFLAEGTLQNPIVFTSPSDDRFGAGGTFDTNNDLSVTTADRGDWSGIYAGPTSNVSFDHVQLSYAGGISLLEGGLARGFAPLELAQAEARITNSQFEYNDTGQDGQGPAGRFGRLSLQGTSSARDAISTIMVRGSQPVIVGNTFVDNRGTIINIDIDSMGGNYRPDDGRETGPISRFSELDDNHGPLIRFNRYQNGEHTGALQFGAGTQLSGLEIRAGQITTETVFDDTDIAHLVFDNIEVGNLHSSGGLRLLSRPDESLVVKFAGRFVNTGDSNSDLDGSGSPNSATWGTGITASGAIGNVDRIGGTVHIIGLPGAPVILTSLQDDSVGAGLAPDGSSFTDHDGDGVSTRAKANDWRGVLLDQRSNDENVEFLPELELLTEVAPGLNATVGNAQFLGELASDLITADHDRRAGFEIDGFLSGTTDIDTYSFRGTPGTEVWVDVDHTSFTLDTVIEILDADGNVLARSDNSAAESDKDNPTPVTVFDPFLKGVTSSLQSESEAETRRNDFGIYLDDYSNNLRDAGIHFPLPGDRTDANSKSVYFVRVRSASLNPDDAAGGITGGQYRLQIRLTEEQAFPGSVVRFADIRYANHGVHVQGLMSNSPLLAEAQENEAAAGVFAQNNTPLGDTLGAGAQYVGNLGANYRGVIGIGGQLSSINDVDFYRFDVEGVQSTVFDIDFADGYNRPDTNISIFYDADGVPAVGAPANDAPQLIYFGSASNILDDQTSPLGENSELERLVRGSITNNDAFVGPVVLTGDRAGAGTYYVAVTEGTRTPETLTLGNVIREPLQSVTRIVEDRFGDALNTTNQDGLTLTSLFDASLLDPSDPDFSGFIINPSDTNPGHGVPAGFFDSTVGGALTGTYEPEPPTSPVNTGEPADEAPSDTTKIIPDLNLLNWSVVPTDTIGTASTPLGGAQNTSATIQHLSINGSLNAANDPADWYLLTPATDGTIYVDIDNGFGVGQSVDAKLIIFNSNLGLPTNFIEIASNSSSSISDGLGGSIATEDPFVEFQGFAGQPVYIAVMQEDATYTHDQANAEVNVTAGTGQGNYILRVSAPDIDADPDKPAFFPAGDQILQFLASDPSLGQGTYELRSEPFDLGGYVAADLPHLYFNRELDLGTADSVQIKLESDSQASTTVIAYTDQDNSTWDQERIDLSAFAGHHNVTLTVEYEKQDTSGVPAGLKIDDVIVGFAERGEQIYQAIPGTAFVATTGVSRPGEYQLEIREGSDFASGTPANVTIETNFDSNDRLGKSISLIAPSGSQIADGSTFAISDGVEIKTFEFDAIPSNGAIFGNIPIRYQATDSSSVIAEKIRFAVNNQSTIRVEASTASGLDGTEVGGGAATDERVALFGARFVKFDEAVLPLQVTYHQGQGDDNFLRRQGVVLIEHNQISDVRGIGVWAEPGDRETVPSHAVAVSPLLNGSLYEQPPVGNSHPGAVINLPELNDSVLGGLAPSVVIQNNTIDQAEYAGVKVQGQTAPWVIEVGTGDTVTDGSTFVIDAGGTRVVFEFEDIGDGEDTAPLFVEPYGGENQSGGDGFLDGHVPVYYRHSDDFIPQIYNLRTEEYTQLEMVHAIREAIQGSILMTNGLAELVEVTVGPSLTANSYMETIDPLFPTLSTPEIAPALYIEGATVIYPNVGEDPRDPYPDVEGSPSIPNVSSEIFAYQAPVYEAPQPFARIVNNTIYGDDGVASRNQERPNEPSDFLVDAIDTRIGGSHRDVYSELAFLGDNVGPLAPEADVDFYRVFLEVGDRLVVDIDTGTGGPETALRVYDASGVPQSFTNSLGNEVNVNRSGVAPGYLDPNGSEPGGAVVDPFMDFTAPKSGAYYVGVSSAGNESYETGTLLGRVDGFGGTGNYQISMQSFAPRSFVMSIGGVSGPNGKRNVDRTGTTGAALLGTTFTVTQIRDIPVSNAYQQGDGTNQVTFEFGGSGVLPNGNVGIPIGAGHRVPDIMKAIESAINGTINTRGLPVLPNYDLSDPANPVRGAVRPGVAQALGGRTGNGDGLTRFAFEPGPPFDNNAGGFGHLDGPGAGSTELYALIENIARIELSPAARSAGLRLDPIAGSDADQLLNETGVLVAGGASPTIINNVFMNLHESLAVEASNEDAGVVPGYHPKDMSVVVAGNVFQDSYGLETEAQGTIGVSHNALTRFANPRGTSNVNGGTDDFNFTLSGGEASLQFPEANNFQPAFGSIIIDSSINSTQERDAMVSVRASVGLPVSNILAPSNDVGGVLRADNPLFSSPGGLGTSVFKDRGSTELADFIGPIAVADLPRDNDAGAIDNDPTIAYINLTDGVYREFRVQLRDNGDSSDPFTGIGIDDSSVVVAEIEGLRATGANFTLRENERLLKEGVDYTFEYDQSRNLVTFKPIAGIWQNDRSYRIQVNNQDRNVMVAPEANQVADGDQLTVLDNAGSEVVFEFETGYSLQIPDPITLVVPREGTDVGGIRDGDLFEISVGVNDPVVFEFNLPGSPTFSDGVEIVLPAEETPTDPTKLDEFLSDIANTIVDKINDSGLDVTAKAYGHHVVVGSERGATATTTSGGLQQLARTLALQVPGLGVEAGGIVDGDTFQISNGKDSTIIFEFDIVGDGVSSVQNQLIDLTTNPTPAEIAVAIRDAIASSPLGLEPIIDSGSEDVVYLNLPAVGDVTVLQGRLEIVGLSRTPSTGDYVELGSVETSSTTKIQLVVEDNDAERDGLVEAENAENTVYLSRSDTAEVIASRISDVMRESQDLNNLIGFSKADLQVAQSGTLVVGGEAGLTMEVSSESIRQAGDPGVTNASTVAVLGPLVMQLPSGGGADIFDGSTIVIMDDFGNDRVFEFDLNAAIQNTNAIRVAYSSNDLVDTVANSLVQAINASGLGISARTRTGGRVDLGKVAKSRVDVSNVKDEEGDDLISLRQGIVSDGEELTISQGAVSVTYEFEASVGGGGVQSGNVAVPFQLGSEPGDVAKQLVEVIKNNLFGLNLDPEVEYDFSGSDKKATGRVLLNDLPSTIVDVTQAPTLVLTGIPGGANPIQFSPLFSSETIKLEMIKAINSVNAGARGEITELRAEDRGGKTLFVSNASVFGGVAADGGYIQNYSLPAVKDLAGNALEPNRPDLSTQFTILMPTASFDFGDAPDPVSGISGRYPTLFLNDGPRHVMGSGLTLGETVDANVDGLPGVLASQDDVSIEVSNAGELFSTSKVIAENGDPTGQIKIQINGNAEDRDGDTVTIDMGTAKATLEFDVKNSKLGAFDEDHYAITPSDSGSSESIAQAIKAAILESPLQPASIEVGSDSDGWFVLVSADDEDGVVFTSYVNPNGVLNKHVPLEIDVSVKGAGVLEAWIDFNADGDWDDPGEQVIPQANTMSFDEKRSLLCNEEIAGIVSNVFDDSGEAVQRTFCIVVPETTPDPVFSKDTYARFRVSREGGLAPDGLALTGEVEDYRLTLAAGSPPAVTANLQSLVFTTNEDALITRTPATGLLAGIVDPDGDEVRVYSEDVGNEIDLFQDVLDVDGNPVLDVDRNPLKINAGKLSILESGAFVFIPAPDFFGEVTHQVRVTDVKQEFAEQLVSPYPVTLTITVNPVNDPPELKDENDEPLVERTLDEDETLTFTAAELTGFYRPGPSNESDQQLIIDSAYSSNGTLKSSRGGTLTIAPDGSSVTYTPPGNDFTSADEYDEFKYVVADVPADGQLSKIASTEGVVRIKINSVNDPPVAVADSFSTGEGQPLTLPITKLTENDSAGPDNEPEGFEFVQLIGDPDVSNAGAVLTANGGSVKVVGTDFTYTPPPGFPPSSTPQDDSFSYQIKDLANPSLTAVGTVTVTVNPVDDPPIFRGLNGVDGYQPGYQDDDLDLEEAKGTVAIHEYDLNTWFNEPDGETMTFSVDATSVDTDILNVEIVDGSKLRISLNPYENHIEPFDVSVTAKDEDESPTTETIKVLVRDTPDSPQLVPPGFVDKTVDEDAEPLRIPLVDKFWDPDGDELNFSYTINGLDTSSSKLIKSIETVGDTSNQELQITLKENQNGSDAITVIAEDGTGRTSTDTFTLTVKPINDPPTGQSDVYPKPGSTIPAPFRSELVINAANGLLINDSDVDGDSLTVELVQSPENGVVILQPDGGFRYTNTGGNSGGFDTFTYKVSDGVLESDEIQVTINLGSSEYQNSFGAYIAGGEDPADGIAKIEAGPEIDGEVRAKVTFTTRPDLEFENGSSRSLREGDKFIIRNSSVNNYDVEHVVTQVISETEFVTMTAYIGDAINGTWKFEEKPFRQDVNGDKLISAIDALHIINALGRFDNDDLRDGQDDYEGQYPISLIGAPPPKYLDVNGDGVVSARDIIAVITALGVNQTPSGEGESVDHLAYSAITTGFASSNTLSVPSRNLEIVQESATDRLFAGEVTVKMESGRDLVDVDALISTADQPAAETSDQALEDWLNDEMFNSDLQ